MAQPSEPPLGGSRPERPTPRPPLIGRLLARAALPRSLRAEFMGDLEEAFRQDFRADGLFRARIRYLRETCSPSLLRLRFTSGGMGLVPGASVHSHSGEPFVASLIRDLRYALRILRRSPGFTAVVVLSLALGIGPNTAIFSLVNSLFFQEDGIHQPDRVLEISSLSRSGRHSQTYYSVYERVLEGTGDVFDQVAAYTTAFVHFESDLGPTPASAEIVTANFFDVLGVGAQAGRTFVPEEGVTAGTHPVVVLSDALWERRYGKDPSAVGSELRINGRPYTIIGVADQAFKGKILPGVEVDVWLPIMMYPHLNPTQMSTSGNLQMSARLAGGIAHNQAIGALDALAARINEERPDSRSTFRFGSYVLSDYYFSPDFDGPITAMAALLLAGVGVVLLVACVNLAGFFLARSTDRRKEMAIRISMGAGKGSIVRQLLVESMALATMGGITGVALGYGLTRVLVNIDPPLPVPLNLDVPLDGTVLGFAALLTAASAALFGLAPATRASRAPVAPTLRDESGSVGGGKGKTRARTLLVMAQMALSMVLLTGAGLFLRSLQAASKVEVGFDTGPAGMVTVNVGTSGYEPDARPELYAQLEAEIASIPGIRAIGSSSRMPLQLGVTNGAFDVPGVAPPENADHHLLELAYVTPGYFDAMGIGILQGRAFERADQEQQGSTVIVTRAAADLFWPGGDPLGRTMVSAGDPSRSWSVVGVTESTKIWSLGEPPRPYLYFPMGEDNRPGLVTTVVRGVNEPASLTRDLTEAVRRVDPELYIVEAKTMREHLRYILFLPQMAAILIGAFAGLALVLAAVGLFGMVSYGVSRRTKELGIRISLGAENSAITRLVMRGAVQAVVVGAAVGLVGAVVASRLVGRFLIGIPWFDPITFFLVPIILGGVALLAAYLPARKANKVDPIGALRAD